MMELLPPSPPRAARGLGVLPGSSCCILVVMKAIGGGGGGGKQPPSGCSGVLGARFDEGK